MRGYVAVHKCCLIHKRLFPCSLMRNSSDIIDWHSLTEVIRSQHFYAMVTGISLHHVICSKLSIRWRDVYITMHSLNTAVTENARTTSTLLLPKTLSAIYTKGQAITQPPNLLQNIQVSYRHQDIGTTWSGINRLTNSCACNITRLYEVIRSSVQHNQAICRQQNIWES